MDLSRRNFLKATATATASALVLPYLAPGRAYGADGEPSRRPTTHLAILEDWCGAESRWVWLDEDFPPAIHVALDAAYAVPSSARPWALSLPLVPQACAFARFEQGRRVTRQLPPMDGDDEPSTMTTVYYRQIQGASLPKGGRV